MGLGPLVCDECRVFAQDRSTNQWGGYRWLCPSCGNEDVLEYLWMYTEEQQRIIENNTKFYRFVEGKE